MVKQLENNKNDTNYGWMGERVLRDYRGGIARLSRGCVVGWLGGVGRETPMVKRKPPLWSAATVAMKIVTDV